MEQEIIIELDGISKKFDSKFAVENFHLKIKKGEFVTFLGPSGCGKTTTLRMIAGLNYQTRVKFYYPILIFLTSLRIGVQSTRSFNAMRCFHL